MILCTSLSRAPLEYYLGRKGIEASFVSFPRDTATHLGSQNDGRWLSRPRVLAREADAAALEALTKAGRAGRIFLVWVRSDVNAALAHDAMKARAEFQYVRYLGRFTQVGTTASIECLWVIPRPSRVRPCSSASPLTTLSYLSIRT